MIRATMNAFMSAAICLAVAFAVLGAQAQSNTEVSAKTNPAIDAVDASVHVEVDGQPHEPTPVDASHEQPTPLHNTKRHPATAFWPARADPSATGSDDKSSSPGVGMSFFRPDTEWGRPSAWQSSASATSTGATNDDSGQDHFQLSNAPPSHLLSFSTKTSSSPRTNVPPVSVSDETTALSAPFGRAVLGLGAITNPFPKRDPSKYKNRTGTKRHQHHSRLSVPATATSSSFDSLATTGR